MIGLLLVTFQDSQTKDTMHARIIWIRQKVYIWTNVGRMCTRGIVIFFRTSIPAKKGKHFNGEIEIRSKPTRRTGDDVFDMVKDLRVIFGKSLGRQPVPNDDDGHVPMWKKKSIFWDLEYWKVLEVRSAIDVMHLTKNLCVNLLGFLGSYGKIKDTPEAREDQQCLKG
jgi:hypothetical protein